MRSHSRATGLVRLVVACWLVAAGVLTLADPGRATVEQGMPMEVVLPLAGLWFALGAFLLTGFMTRVCGLALVGLTAWQQLNFGVQPMPLLLGLAGVYLMLRGGGAWAMDIYVQKMQDRVRNRAVSSPEST